MGQSNSLRSDNRQDDFDEFDDPFETLWEEEEEEEEDGEEDEEDENDDEEDVSKFTQSDFDRAVSKARKSARSAATKKLLEDLGVTTPEEAKALVQTARNKEGKGKEAEAANSDEVAKLKAENARILSESLKRETTGRVKDALVDAGIPVKAAAKAAKLIELESDNPSDEEIADEVEELKESMPQLFNTASKDDEDEDEDETPRGKKGTTPPPPKRKRKGATPEEQAQEIFRKRHPQATTKS